MKYAKLQMPRLVCIPWLLAVGLLLGWADSSQAVEIKTTMSPSIVREDAGAQDITVKFTVSEAAASDILILVSPVGPTAAYANVLYRLSLPSFTIKKGQKEATGVIRFTPINNDYIGVPVADSTKNQDRDDIMFSRATTVPKDSLTRGTDVPILFSLRAGSHTFGLPAAATTMVEDGALESDRTDTKDDKYLLLLLVDDDKLSSRINLSVEPAELAKGADATSVTVTATLNGKATGEKLDIPFSLKTGGLTRDVHYTLSGLSKLTIPKGKTSGSTTFTVDPTGVLPDGTEAKTIEIGPTASTVMVPSGMKRKTKVWFGDPTGEGVTSDGHGYGRQVKTKARSRTNDVNSSRQPHYTFVDVSVDLDMDGSVGGGRIIAGNQNALDSGWVPAGSPLSNAGVNAVLEDWGGSDTVPAGTRLLEIDSGIDFNEDGDFYDVFVVPADSLVRERGVMLVSKAAHLMAQGEGRTDTLRNKELPRGLGDFNFGELDTTTTFWESRTDGQKGNWRANRIFPTPTWPGTVTIPYVASLPPTKVTSTSVKITIAEAGVAKGKSFTLAPATIRENAGATDVQMTVELEKAITKATTVTFKLTPTAGSGTRDVDYVSDVVGGAVTIAAGDKKGTGTLRVTPVDNDKVGSELDQWTFEVEAMSGTTSLGKATFTITDDEALSENIVLSASPSEIKEDAGATTVTISGALDGKPLAADAAITLVVDSTPDKSATGYVDYTAVLGVLTIPQGELTGSTTVTITPINDGVAADDKDKDEKITLKQLTDNLKNQDDDKIMVKSVAITLKEVALDTTTTTPGTGVAMGPSFGADSLAFAATVGQAFSAVLPEATGGEGPLMYRTSTALPAGLSFAPATRTISGMPTMAGLATVVYTALDSEGHSGARTFTITVSEARPITVGVASAMASQSAVREDGETAEIQVTATLSGAATTDQRVRFTIVPPSSGTLASRDVDYTATLGGTVTIAAGGKTGSTTLFLSPIDNAAADGHRYLGIRASASGGWAQVDLRISDDETASTSLVMSVMPSQLSESADLTEVQVMAALDGKPLAEDATVALSIDRASTATRDIDYSALFNPSITLAAGSVMGSTRLLLDPVADSMTEGDETIMLTAMLSGLDAGSATLVLTDTDSEMMGGDDDDMMMMPLAFVEGASIAAQSYTAGTAIHALELPATLGGEGAITYSVSDLPAGLSFDAATRMISGTPEAATDGAVEVTYTAMAGDESVSLMFTITVNPMLDFGDLSSLFGVGVGKANPADSHDDSSLQLTVGVPVDLTLPAVSGGTPPLMYSVSGLPAGLSFDPATRMISGMPDMAGKSVITYMVTDASGATRSVPVSVSVMEPPLAAPTNLVAEDYKGADGQGDQGGFVMLSWDLSADHASLDGYRIFRALPVLGNEMVPWALVDAVPGVAMGRAIVATLDNVSTRWGIAAESGGRTTHTMAKAVFVEADDLTAPYAEMAETLAASRAAAQAGEGPVMASLLPDALAYAEGVAPKLNVVGGVLSSSITWTAEAVGATDDIAPLAVPSLRVLDAPDDAGGRLALTWALSPSDQLVQGVVAGAIGPAPVAPIVGVHGYRIYRRAAGEEAFSLVAEVAAGVSSFVDETALNGVHYTYQVRPFDWDNEPGAEVEQTALAVRNRAVDRQGRVLLGLFGADGRIGFDDFFLLADQFGLTAEDAGFDPAFDLAPNATIDFDDFFVLADHFGRRLASAGKPVPLRAGLNADARLSLDAPTALPSVGEEFVVAVRWSDFSAVQGYGLQVGYDADKLSFVSVQTDQPLGSSAFAAPQVLSDQAGVLTVVAHGDAVSDGELGLRLVFRPTTEIASTTLEITDNQTYDNALGFNRLALPAPVSLQTRPAVFSLADNYPNPFNPATTLQYALPQAADVALTVYNVLGQPVRTLVAERQAAGRYAVEWDATNDQGHSLSSGLYFYRLQAGGDFLEVKKMLLLK